MIVSLENRLPLKMETDQSMKDSKRKIHIFGWFTGVLTLLAIWSSVVLLYLAQCNQELQVNQLMKSLIFFGANIQIFSGCSIED